MSRMHTPCFAALLGTLIVHPAPTAQAADRPGTVTYTLYDEPKEMLLDTTRVAVLGVPDLAQRFPGAEAQGVADWTLCPLPQNLRSDAAVRMLAANPAHLLGANVPAAPGAFISPIMLAEGNDYAIPTRDILVRFDADVTAAQAEAILINAKIGETIERRFGGLSNAFRIRSNAVDGFGVLDQANALAAVKGVRFAEPDMIATGETDAVPNDIGFPYAWQLSNTGQYGGTPGFDIQARPAWDITTGSPSIITVILDNGVQQDHPDINQIAGADFTGQGTTGGPVHPCDKHGTAVAGCLAGIINNNVGVCGVAPSCRVASARVMSATNACTTAIAVQYSWIINGIYWAQNIGARITNSSFRLSTNSAALNDAYANTRAAGIIHFGAAGNQSTGAVAYPASLPSVVSVASINGLGARSGFSNWGDGLDFSVPGESIATADLTGPAGYAGAEIVYGSGTSYASPTCAGTAALALSQNPSLTPDQVEQTLRDSCRDLGAPGYDTDYGWGLPSAYKALTGVAPPAEAPLAGTCLLETPASFATSIALNPLLNWSDSANAVSYLIAIDNDLHQESALITQFVTASEFQIPVGVLAQGVTYYWRVVAFNAAGVPTISQFSSIAFTTAPPPTCPGDTNGDNQVNTLDLTALLGVFAQSVPAGLPPDFAPDGTINTADLVIVLGTFGQICP